MDTFQLAELLFPDTIDRATFEKNFLKRDLPKTACVTRFAPSPTGYMHIGGLYISVINQFVAKNSGGVFYLRIEDTDEKRLIENGITEIIKTLEAFHIRFDEGPTDEHHFQGQYGPYKQSDRKSIYAVYAKDLVKQGLAYPCFCSDEELEAIREEQKNNNENNIGYFGKWAKYRHMSWETVKDYLQQGKSYVIRLKALGDGNETKEFPDLIRGNIAMPENFMDIVLLKSNGIPTYHFAHAVDDHLMGTTHVIRADEWMASLPIHVQLFEMLNFPVPQYAHVSPILKMEGSSKRKLSKRKDPEARVGFYYEQGYPVMAIIEYLLTICNSSFEEWREANPDADVFSFPMELSKMNLAGALFDFHKLDNISKVMIKNMSMEEAARQIQTWAKSYDETFYRFILQNPEKFMHSLHIWKANRMDVAKWSEVPLNYPYLYNEQFEEQIAPLPEVYVSKKEGVVAIVKEYMTLYDDSDDQSLWFEKTKVLAEKHGYCTKMKLYKKNPEEYEGSIADVCTYIRLAVTGLLESPELFLILQHLGTEKVLRRMEQFIKINESLK